MFCTSSAGRNTVLIYTLSTTKAKLKSCKIVKFLHWSFANAISSMFCMYDLINPWITCGSVEFLGKLSHACSTVHKQQLGLCVSSVYLCWIATGTFSDAPMLQTRIKCSTYPCFFSPAPSFELLFVPQHFKDCENQGKNAHNRSYSAYYMQTEVVFFCPLGTWGVSESL